MTRRARNPCVYTGFVGARMRPIKPRVTRRIFTREVTLSGGPLDKAKVHLDADTGLLATLPLAPMNGWPAGRYVRMRWTPETLETP